jgi:predicted nucleotidyltransferase component of viral defense system
MDNAIRMMLERYECNTSEQHLNALKEIIQELALLGLWRAKFFEHAAFYGGTALRILYRLDRFSEDLDFSLLELNQDFDIESFLHEIENELAAFGFTVSVQKKKKTQQSVVQSAFLKANTKERLLKIEAPEAIAQEFYPQAILKVKLEIDTQPPLGFTTENKQLLTPIPFSVRTYSLPDMFAGKVSAALCREWKGRTKGRDWYDLLWFIQRGEKLHLSHLEKRLRDTNHYHSPENLEGAQLQTMLINKIQNLDMEQVKQDILPFIRHKNHLDGWSKEMFLSAIQQIQCI